MLFSPILYSPLSPLPSSPSPPTPLLSSPLFPLPPFPLPSSPIPQLAAEMRHRDEVRQAVAMEVCRALWRHLCCIQLHCVCCSAHWLAGLWRGWVRGQWVQSYLYCSCVWECHCVYVLLNAPASSQSAANRTGVPLGTEQARSAAEPNWMVRVHTHSLVPCCEERYVKCLSPATGMKDGVCGEEALSSTSEWWGGRSLSGVSVREPTLPLWSGIIRTSS